MENTIIITSNKKQCARASTTHVYVDVCVGMYIYLCVCVYKSHRHTSRIVINAQAIVAKFYLLMKSVSRLFLSTKYIQVSVKPFLKCSDVPQKHSVCILFLVIKETAAEVYTLQNFTDTQWTAAIIDNKTDRMRSHAGVLSRGPDAEGNGRLSVSKQYHFLTADSQQCYSEPVKSFSIK